MISYRVKLEADDNGTLLVTCPDLPEVTTHGEDEADARSRALDAIEEAIAARIADREPIPPARRKGEPRVFLPTQTTLKVRLYNRMLAEGVNKAQLAERLHVHRPQVDRLLDLRHASRLDQLDAAFGALGSRIAVEEEQVA
ncbi:MAG: type II toxin-antitoxin system HicB family antitoxin [Alphaproteobacteria bacterium]|nr:type II toxin-antitoxin system HicB family antitoxin [Alphaproteobacteria bacterium]